MKVATKLKATAAIIKSKSIAHVMIQKLGAAMGIHSRACQMQKNLCSQNFLKKINLL